LNRATFSEPPSMFEADRDKLIKILRMFSSNHDGEVASAARRAHDLIKARALDWDDLIIRVRNSSSGYSHQRQPEPDWEEVVDDDEATMIRRCAERSAALSAWENEFIESISGSILEWGKLTPKQHAVLDRIVNKLKLRGIWEDI